MNFERKKIFVFFENWINILQLNTLFFLFIIYILFQPFWNNLYQKYIIDFFLKFFNNSIYSTIIFYLIFGYLSFITIKRIKKNYQISSFFTLFSFLLTTIYLCFYRFDTTYIYFRLKWPSFLYYSDIVIFPFLYSIILIAKNLISADKKNKIRGQGFQIDDPITNSKYDLYNRLKYAQELAERINYTQLNEAFAIGINAKWGLGKTSFLNLVKEKLDSNKNIIIDFNAWGNLNEEILINNFFKTIQKAVKSYSSFLSKSVWDYSESLMSLSSNNIFNFGLNILGISSKNSLNEKFNDVNKIIKSIDKKLIIFIDDLDRLQKDEIIQVIKLIRNTANFNDTVFLVAYDRDYVIKAFDELAKTNNRFFLEKIFQIEIDLPHIDFSVLRKELVEQLKANISTNFHLEIEKLYSSNTSGSYPFLDKYLLSFRDVKRFVNLFSFQFNQIYDNVSFTDYFNITLIKTKYPELVQIIYNEQDIYFKKSTHEGVEKLYLIIEKEKTLLLKNLNNRRKELNLSEFDITLFEEAVKYIFGHLLPKETKTLDSFIKTFYSPRDNNSIAFPNTFYRYFSNQIFSFDISEKEWNDSYLLPFDEHIKILKQWVDKGARNEVYFRFNLTTDYKTEENFERIIKAIFQLSNYTTQIDSKPTQAWFDYKELSDKLKNKKNIVEKYYNNNESKYLEFLRDLLSEAQEPFTYTTGFINFECEKLNYDFPIPQNELLHINIQYLKKYLETTDLLDTVAWDLFYDCRYVEFLDNKYHHPIKKEAKVEMQKYFNEKGITFFLESFAIALHSSEKYYIANEIWAIFDTPDDVLKFVDQFQISPLITEFIDFFNSCKETSFNQAIEYSFKHINQTNNSLKQ